MTQHVRNILKVYRRATESDTINGVEWYDRAKRAAQDISQYTNLNVRTVIFVMAALSPNNRCERTVLIAFFLDRKSTRLNSSHTW